MKTTIKSRQMKVLHYPFFSILLLSLVFIGCKKESPLPILETTVATSVYGTSATSGGTVITRKSAFLQESGVCWSTNNNPDINDFRASEGPSYLSIFVSVMDGLTPETEYYYRAYTISSEGVAYGNTLKLKTLSDSSAFLQTDSICFLTLRTARAYAFLDYPGGYDRIQRKGFCYSDQPIPTLSDTVVDYTQSPSYSGFYSLLTFDTGATLNVRAFIELKNGKVYYGEPLSVKPGKIEITAVDRLTFRSARITIENDPHPSSYFVQVTHPHSNYLLRFYEAGATTYRAYLSGLKPDTTYQVQAWLWYSGDLYWYADYAGSLTFTTPPLPYIGNGSYEEPYTVDGAIYYSSFPEHVWVEGYIVGVYSSSSGSSNYNPPFNTIDNILIAGDAEEIFRRNTIQVNLPQGPIQDTLNLKDNPENKGAKLKIYGKVNVVSNAVAITEIQDFELIAIKL